MSLSDGAPAKVGEFQYEDGKLTFVRAGEKKPVSREEFLSLFGVSFPDARGRPVLLTDAVRYFRKLDERFSGYTWIEAGK